MRVAVQISGDFRLCHLTFHTFRKHLAELSGCEVDVFVHTWRRETSALGTFPWQERGLWHKTVFVYSHGDGLALYRPRAYLIESHENKQSLQGKPRSYSMYYSIWRVNETRKEYERLTGERYDWVVRYRTDCVLEEPLAALQEAPTGDCLCIPKPRDDRILADGPDEEAICDWFAYGTPQCMDAYCATYKTWMDRDDSPLPERMLADHLRQEGVLAPGCLQRPVVSFRLVDGLGQTRCMRPARV